MLSVDILKALWTAGRVLPSWDLLPRGNPPDLVKVILWHYQTAVARQRILSLAPENGLSWTPAYQVDMALGFVVKRYRCAHTAAFYYGWVPSFRMSCL